MSQKDVNEENLKIFELKTRRKILVKIVEKNIGRIKVKRTDVDIKQMNRDIKEITE